MNLDLSRFIPKRYRHAIPVLVLLGVAVWDYALPPSALPLLQARYPGNVRVCSFFQYGWEGKGGHDSTRGYILIPYSFNAGTGVALRTLPGGNEDAYEVRILLLFILAAHLWALFVFIRGWRRLRCGRRRSERSGPGSPSRGLPGR